MMPAEILMVSGQILAPKEDRHTDSFVPLVFEHFGRWGEKAEGFLKELAQLMKMVILTLVSSLATGESVYH